jgi:predicted dehydrogenase
MAKGKGSSKSVAQGKAKAQRKLRVGFIGTGMIAMQAHMPGWKAQAANAELVAGADILPDRAKAVAEKMGIARSYGDWRKMLRKEDLDVVIVATPNSYHKEQSIAALQAGAHVLCEKPAATSAPDAAAMFAAAKKAGRHLFIGQSARFLHRAKAAREILASGRLGDVYFAETNALRRRGVPQWGQFHMKQHSGGGPIYDLGVHAIDMLYWLMGNPRATAVSGVAYTKLANRDEGLITSAEDSGAFEGVAMSRPYDYRDFDVEDMAAGLIRLDGGLTIVLKTSWAANVPKYLGGAMILGTEAGLTLEPLALVANRGSYQATDEVQLPDEPHGWFTGHHREAAHFVRVIRGEEPLLVREAEVLNVMRTLDALYASSDTGKEVVIG